MVLINKLRKKFFHGLIWNGFSYAIYKISFVSLSFILYNTLSINKFSSWALTNSTIFLLLLWLDCGLRKSIPRYSPIFARNSKLHRHFIRGVIAFQALILTFVGIPLLLICLKQTLPGYYFYVLWRYATLLFVSEGMIAILRLVYHAHFLQRYFNILYTIGIVIEMIAHLVTIQSFYSPKAILIQILINKMVVGFCVVIVALATIKFVYKEGSSSRNEPLDFSTLFPSFFMHSFMMWSSTTIKSLSERNFMLLFLTRIMGPVAAHLFKLSHDSAVLFQRIILKTIGISDTSILSHAQEETKSNKAFKDIFGILFRTIFLLCLPLLPFVFFAFAHLSSVTPNSSTLTIFIIFIFGYLIEIIFSPYERVLETKRNYRLLWLCYTPYIFFFVIGVLLLVFNKISLIVFLFIVQSSRVASALSMAVAAHKHYL